MSIFFFLNICLLYSAGMTCSEDSCYSPKSQPISGSHKCTEKDVIWSCINIQEIDSYHTVYICISMVLDSTVLVLFEKKNHISINKNTKNKTHNQTDKQNICHHHKLCHTVYTVKWVQLPYSCNINVILHRLPTMNTCGVPFSQLS